MACTAKINKTTVSCAGSLTLQSTLTTGDLQWMYCDVFLTTFTGIISRFVFTVGGGFCLARIVAGDGSPNTVNRFQPSYVVGCRLLSFMADSFEAGVSERLQRGAAQ